jgi:hypothetical protein
VPAFQKTMREMAVAKLPFVSIQVMRGIYTLYVELEPKWEHK